MYVNQEHTLINCEVDFEGIGIVPFTASSEDVATHGRQIFQELKEGKWGDIQEYTPPKPKDLSNEEIITQKRAVITNYLNEKAKEYGYDSIDTVVTYADEPSVPKFQAEGIAFRNWRSCIWEFGYALIEECLAGTKPIPTDEELISMLPKLEVIYSEA